MAGSGNPQVRAGVLRLASALPDITVAYAVTRVKLADIAAGKF